jgi:succinate-semialdehyde dehydrogenase
MGTHHRIETESSRLVEAVAFAGPDKAGIQLSDPQLFRELAFIDGKWRSAESGARLPVTDPATGNFIGTVANMGVAETRGAIAAAEAAFPAWRAKLPQDRAKILRNWHDLMMAHRDDLAKIMTLEQGKPLAESLAEIDYAASFLEWFGEEAKRLGGDIIASHLPNRQMTARREPLGVAAAITPWNFPSAMITRKAGAALGAGCTLVVRPASETPFSALALAELAGRAGVPPGVLSVVTGEAEEIVRELCANPAVRAVSFTGSTEVGKRLIRLGADTVKRMSMELGGHAPFIVFPDVDLNEAVEAAAAAKFQTSGQDCLAANRIFVHGQIYEEFLSRFAARVAALRVGNGFEPGAEIGPLMHERAAAKCAAHVSDALAKGGRLLVGGGRHELGGLFFAPTVIADATDEMLIFREETFGPVAAVSSFTDEDEVIRRASATNYGLIAYLFITNQHTMHRVCNALPFGMVAVNCASVTGAPIPFGGFMESGLGREGGGYGFDAFTDIKYVCAAYRPRERQS